MSILKPGLFYFKAMLLKFKLLAVFYKVTLNAAKGQHMAAYGSQHQWCLTMCELVMAWSQS